MVSAVVNRREMLQIVGGAAAAGIVPARAEAQPRSFGSDEVVDVAVVGAGISGLYSAWRLRTETRGVDGAAPKVIVLETSQRIGGRLLSVAPPGIPGTRVELGGMRFSTGHRRLSALVDHFGLLRDDFPVSDPQNIAYVRGRMLRHQDLLDANALPYNLAPDERAEATLGDGFTALAARRALRAMFGKDVPLNEVDWNEVALKGRYEGKRLSDIPLQFVLQRSVSEEAFRFAVDTSGYDSILHTWNAADGFPWNLSDFAQAVSFFHLRDGLEQVPVTIAARFQDAGGRIFLEQRLKSFDQTILPDGSAGVELHVASGDQSVRIVRARKLILAMPRRSLELLDQTGAVLGPENGRVHELIRSVQPIPLFKLALCYSYPWWETVDAVQVQGPGGTTLANITRGRSVTDLPLRQCYYWAKDESSQKAVVLIYDDGADLDFWAGLRDLGSNEPFEPDVRAMAADTPLPESWSAHRAPRLMVEEAHRQMLIVHGARNRTDVPMPYAAAYRDWGENPFGGGANFWRVNVRSDEVFQDILQPKPPVPVYVCGEAYSHHQGWAEGPLATADAMLERHFGVGPPGWLKL